MNEISKLQVFPVAPSGPFSKEQYETGIKIIEKMGLKIIKPIPFRHSEVSYLNGSDEERIGELNQAFKSDEKTILWVARGGYGVTRILAHLKISRKKKLPVVLGFSDTTALMMHLWAKYKIKSIHATTITRLSRESKETLKALSLIFKGQADQIKYPSFQRYDKQKGDIQGILIPCNLCMLTQLIKTPSMPNLSNSILILEDTGEVPYKIDRMLTHLKGSGSLKSVKAIVLGYFTPVEEEKNKKAAKEALLDVLLREFEKMKIPVFGQIPVGHEFPNWPIPLGVKGQIKTKGKTTTLRILENIF